MLQRKRFIFENMSITLGFEDLAGTDHFPHTRIMIKVDIFLMCIPGNVF